MRSFVKQSYRWFMSDIPIYPAIIARIGFGLTLFFCYLLRWSDVPFLYGPQGLGSSHLALTPSLDEVFVRKNPWPWGEALQLIPDMSGVWILYGALLLSSLCFALGFKTRVSGVIALLLHAIFHSRAPFNYWGWATMIKPYMIYVLFTPCYRYFSLDTWLIRQKNSLPQTPVSQWLTSAWPLRIFQIHVCTMYAEAGWSRLDKPGWNSGEALVDALINHKYGRFEFDFSAYAPVLEFFGQVAVFVEAAAPLALWAPWLAPWFVLILFALHITLELTVTIGWWQHIMIIGLTLFLPQRWLKKFFQLLSGQKLTSSGQSL